ncbi:MAG: lipase family protein [Aestuariivirga sp.]
MSPAIAPGTLLRAEKIQLPVFYRAKAWRILYMTRDYENKPVVSSGVIVLSGYASADQRNRKIVAWAHPVTGIARNCAPSLRQSPIESIAGFNKLITDGYIIAATDYPGLGTAGPVGFLIGKGQGQAVLDSVRAARQIPDVGGGKEFALWGYSQGAHATLFASALASSYAPELTLVGVAAAAPPTDLADLFQQDIRTLEGRIVVALTLQSWSDKYKLSLSSLLDNRIKKVVTEVADICVDDLGGKLNILTAQKPLEHKFLHSNPTIVAPWRHLLSTNSVSKLPVGAPTLIIQGGSDELVHPKVTSQFVKEQCARDEQIKLLILPGKNHSDTEDASSKPALDWIKDRFTGKPAPISCGVYVAE